MNSPELKGSVRDPDRGPPLPAPRWVKIFGITLVTLLLVFAVLHLTGFHGGHSMSGDSKMNMKEQ